MDFSMPTSPNPSTNVTITKEEFNLFHNIDRQLFTRLVVGIGRDTTQSINVMAFILWVERKSKNSKTVTNLLQWPNEMLNKLSDEAVVVLTCIESPESPLEKAIPLIQSLMRCGVTLQYFHEHRMEIISALTKLLNDVCLRAFTDIVLQVQYTKAMKEHEVQLANIYGTMPLHPMQPQQVVYYAPIPPPPPHGVPFVPPQPQVVVPQWHNLGVGSSNAPFESHYDASKHMDFNPDISDILAKLGLNDDAPNVAAAEKIEVPVDERTIFLTFSKGYPISNMELREFFTRAYGDIIETLYMQDVQPSEQPLYARLVIRPGATDMIDRFLEGTDKVKFAINGKHVWARKYVRKSQHVPSGEGTSYA